MPAVHLHATPDPILAPKFFVSDWPALESIGSAPRPRPRLYGDETGQLCGEASPPPLRRFFFSSTSPSLILGLLAQISSL